MNKKKTIIMGNGVNINFDENKKRWKKFNVDCQVNFLCLINDAKESKDHRINSIFCVWDLIKNFIDLDQESKSLENITRFFIFWNYKKFMINQNEYIDFLSEIWAITVTPFLEESQLPIKVPNFLEDAKALFEVNTHLGTISQMYKKAIEITLFDEYKINDINIPNSFILFLENNFKNIISLNYDSNLDDVKGLIKLHGSYNKSVLNYEGDINIPEDLKEWVKFYKENTLQWDMVLEKESKVKSRQLRLLKEWKKHGISPTLHSFGIANKYMDTKKFSISEVSSYEELKSISGTVEILGMSTENDEVILEILLGNDSIDKIIFYGDKNEEVNDKLIYRHFSEFWNKISGE